MVRILLIFLIIFLGFLFSTNIFKGNEDERRKRYIYIISLLLILQSGLRNWAVGSDTYQYYYMFNDVARQSWQEVWYNFIHSFGKDPFYDIFQKSFQIFSTNYQIYLIFVACIFIPSLGVFIFKNTTRLSHAIVSFVIYMGYFYGFYSITGIRQTLATALLLYSYEFIKKKRFFIFLLFVGLASLIHISALVFILLYFVGNIKKAKYVLWFALLGFPLIMILKNQLAVFFVSFLEMEDRFGVYTEQFERGGSLILTSFHIILTIIALFFYTRVGRIKSDVYHMYNMFSLALFFLPLQWVNPSAGRISQYFALVMIVWIPYLLDSMSNNSRKAKELVYGIAIFTFIIITFFSIRVDGEYNFFWQYMPVPY